ncbi:MAG: hypothetical protein AAGA32_21495 [Pseudomonadota bacterium]
MGTDAENDLAQLPCGSAAAFHLFENLNAFLDNRASVQAKSGAPRRFLSARAQALPGYPRVEVGSADAARSLYRCLDTAIAAHSSEELMTRLESSFTRPMVYLTLASGPRLPGEARACF